MDDEIRERMRMRVPVSEIEAQMDELKKKAEDAAIRQIKAYVVINEIGEAEGIEVNEEDFDAEAGRIGRPGANLAEISRLLQSGEYKDEYRERIFRRKALAVVMDHATVTDKPVSREELDKKDEEIEAEA
jgi:FKBP-type peptidyl-prolyl cis-trans isomerase (trigger factor)